MCLCIAYLGRIIICRHHFFIHFLPPIFYLSSLPYFLSPIFWSSCRAGTVTPPRNLQNISLNHKKLGRTVFCLFLGKNLRSKNLCFLRYLLFKNLSYCYAHLVDNPRTMLLHSGMIRNAESVSPVKVPCFANIE